MAKEKTESDKLLNIKVNRAVLSKYLKVTPERITQLVLEGMPKNKNGSYTLKDCIHFYFDFKKIGEVLIPEELIGPQERISVAKAEKIERENAIAERQLIPIDETLYIISHLAGVIIGQLDGLAPRMAGRLAGIDDPPTLQKELFEESMRIRKVISQTLEEDVREIEKKETLEKETV